MNTLFKSLFLILALASAQQTKTFSRENLKKGAYLSVLGGLSYTIYNLARPKNPDDRWICHDNIAAVSCGICLTAKILYATRDLYETSHQFLLRQTIAHQKETLQDIKQKRKDATRKQGDVDRANRANNIKLTKIASSFPISIDHCGPFDDIRAFTLTPGDGRYRGTLIDEYWSEREVEKSKKELGQLEKKRILEITSIASIIFCGCTALFLANMKILEARRILWQKRNER